LEALADRKNATPVRYVAIDQFELGGGSLKLRDFHVRLRSLSASVQMVPMEVTAGLQRIASTTGAVDAIIWAEPQPPTDRQLGLLARISKPETTLVQYDGERWIETEIERVSVRAA
ncbi:MAG: hypothetical protein AAFX06_29385, partial [Planctomycetota bacterium]